MKEARKSCLKNALTQMLAKKSSRNFCWFLRGQKESSVRKLYILTVLSEIRTLMLLEIKIACSQKPNVFSLELADQGSHK